MLTGRRVRSVHYHDHTRPECNPSCIIIVIQYVIYKRTTVHSAQFGCLHTNCQEVREAKISSPNPQSYPNMSKKIPQKYFFVL